MSPGWHAKAVEAGRRAGIQVTADFKFDVPCSPAPTTCR
jgi:hypothetical protein